LARAVHALLEAVLSYGRQGDPAGEARSAMRDVGRAPRRTGRPPPDNPKGRALLRQSRRKSACPDRQSGQRRFPRSCRKIAPAEPFQQGVKRSYITPATGAGCPLDYGGNHGLRSASAGSRKAPYSDR
jgi:hypothetical protein